MIRIERKHLALVTTIAQAGTMTAAADALALTQPALSKQLAQLEAMLGVQLFERTAKSSATGHFTMRLTRPGRQFEQRARDMLADLENLESGFSTRQGTPAGRLRIATDVIHDDVRVARAMRAFSAGHADVELDARPVMDPLKALADRQVDIAIVGEAPRRTGLRFTAISTDELVVVMAADHELANRDAVAPKDFEAQDLLYHLDLERSILYRRYLRPAGVRISGFHRIESPAAILASLTDSQALTILPRRIVEASGAAPGLAICPFAPDGYSFTWYAATLRSDTRPETAAFVDRLAELDAVAPADLDAVGDPSP